MKKPNPAVEIVTAVDDNSPVITARQQQQQQQQMPSTQQQTSIPLDWTRVQRKRTDTAGSSKNANVNSNSTNTTTKKRPWSTTVTDNTNIDICPDLGCRRCQDDALFVDSDLDDCTTTTTSAVTTIRNHNNNNNNHDDDDSTQRRHFMSGTVIFCLSDPDCDWFQGYYFPFERQMADDGDDNDTTSDRNTNNNNHGNTYYGLLCHVKPDIDECLQCTAGGYREISVMSMTLMKYKQPHQPQPQQLAVMTNDTPSTVVEHTVRTSATGHQQQEQQRPPPKRINVSNIIWLGADMMNLYMTTKSNYPSQSLSTRLPVGSTNNNTNDDATTTKSNVSVLRMQTTTLYTGSDRVTPYVQKYFTSLLCYMSQQQESESQQESPRQISSSVSKHQCRQLIDQLMPDVAIVVGTMDLWLS